ncbi:MOSC and FAD-binding oxidoreductase domain-containing protein [Flavitalea sp. BT771]|uniref:MOSC and FAD-binding oxidoreductase domain-containing protein n=1 Tax=Flavitalea sp. BT771 TaxID=3063329 RepID=UPI0026E38B16|nr:MOSC and FAD-binding oxidoreductase domain-containing protein [Flavitalea sp. BT771]MDO6429606.1 MOSC and FAD-binding oxidoreductase domain-containing protein [Flavitalea sp. BT771]MDV6218266.1 MOSC and FAD-binding oxidoreductase domain-containing protein [Flavitalea sp. BT771]
MKVISINVSLPKEVDWHGRKITTSIFKTPVEGRRHVGKLNIGGDGQADLQAHGGEHRAIFVYQKDSYDYWKKELGLENLHYGQFGENLTVEGLPDSEVCIGDRFQIGTVILEVTQPRVTCYKVALSTGVPEMPALLVSHKRPGFYCRVICEGDMEAGDEIKKLFNGKGGMTIAEVDGLLYSNAHPRDRLRQVLDIEALSAGWRSSFQALYQAAVSGSASGNAGLAPSAMLAAWQGFVPFIVTRIVVESEGVHSFELSPMDGRRLPEFVAGQHIVVKIPGLGGAPLIRMYSICGPVNETYYRIGVKAELNGVGSDYLFHHLGVGDRLEISAPRGDFTLAQNARPLILLGAGIGITPLLAMLYAAAADGDQREVWWIYTTQDKGHYPFRDEVGRISGNIVKYHGHTSFTRPQAGDILGLDFEASDRLTPEKLKQLDLPGDGDYYLCGPPTFMMEISAALKSLGLPASAIKQEAFGNLNLSIDGKKPPHVPEGSPGEGPVVAFAKSGISFKWHPRFTSLLEAAEACDVPVSWSCRVGVCHRCETTLFSGEVNYISAPLDQPTAGNVLICCSVPRADVQLDL